MSPVSARAAEWGCGGECRVGEEEGERRSHRRMLGKESARVRVSGNADATVLSRGDQTWGFQDSGSLIVCTWLVSE